MALSQNGWPVLDTAPPAVTIPGTEIKLRVRPGDVAVVLMEVARRWHKEVEPLTLPGEADEWGWAVRMVRGSTTFISNHASGTAIDLNATRNPRGVSGTLTTEQVAACHRIEKALGVVTWGGDWSGKSEDSMHWEVRRGVSADEVKRVADVLRERDRPKPTPEPVKAPSVQEDDMPFTQEQLDQIRVIVGAAVKDVVAEKYVAVGWNPTKVSLVQMLSAASGGGRRADDIETKVDRVIELLSDVDPTPGDHAA